MMPRSVCSALLLAALALPGLAAAQGFSALVSPPRFEDGVKPGEVYRNVIDITNVSGAPTRLALRTADWSLREDGTVDFYDDLQTGSCRPWVGLEAHEVAIGPQVKRRFRFEVAVPADAPAGECRFSILIEGDPSEQTAAMVAPVSGRIGVIVYLAIGEGAPRLEILETLRTQVDGHDVPALRVINRGNAHGRLEGFADGTDADGKRWTLAPSSLPLLPDTTRIIALAPADAADVAGVPTYPVVLTGNLDVGAQKLPLDGQTVR